MVLPQHGITQCMDCPNREPSDMIVVQVYRVLEKPSRKKLQRYPHSENFV